MYTREEARALVDKVIALGTEAKADSVEVNLTGGERSGTRWANSSITTNLVQYDRQIAATRQQSGMTPADRAESHHDGARFHRHSEKPPSTTRFWPVT